MRFYDEPCTLENMTPEHIRILDHKFLGSFEDDIFKGNKRRMHHAPVKIAREQEELKMFKNPSQAAKFLDVNHKTVKRAIVKDKKIKGYTIEMVNIDNE